MSKSPKLVQLVFLNFGHWGWVIIWLLVLEIWGLGNRSALCSFVSHGRPSHKHHRYYG
jgi:hypothetical protein